MTSFKDLFLSEANLRVISFPSVTLTLKNSRHTLQLRFDSRDLIVEAAYSGKADPWLSSLCQLLQGKTLAQAYAFDQKNWEEAFRDDQTYWDMRVEMDKLIFHPALELLRAALDVYRGRDYLYHESSSLICRCFGVREADVLEFLKTEEDPTLEKLSSTTKAGMGCRSCVPQLKRWLAINSAGGRERFHKGKTHAEWLLLIDEALQRFSRAQEWQMTIESFKARQVVISYDKEVGQREEEQMAAELQRFLGAAVDPELGFFLRRSRQRSKAER